MVVDSSPDVISRFFRHANYSEVESQLVADLLLTEKYNSYESLPTVDLRETIIGAPP